VLVTVNGFPITEVDFDRELTMNRQKIPLKLSTYQNSEMETTRQEILDRLINFELLYQKSQQKGIVVSDSEIDQYFRELKSQFKEQSGYAQYLDGMKFSETSAREYTRRELSVNRFINTIETEILPVGEDEKKQYYDNHRQRFLEPEQIRIDHIVLRMSQTATEQEQIEAIEKLSNIRDQVEKKEASFAELARTQSEDVTAENGGELGYFKRGQLIKPFEDAAFSLEVGEISGVVITPYGYHLITVTEKIPEKELAYAEVQNEITKILTVERMKTAVAVLLESARNSSDIKVLTQP
jgi:peptidyl-prolyl cis-trans isomerase C